MNHPSLATILLGALFLSVACASPEPGPGKDGVEIVVVNVDSLARAAVEAALELRDSAKTTLATLLDNPASAVFGSLVVIQPPEVEGRLPSPAVCGWINGTPGIGGRSTPTRFVYQSKWTVFVEEEANRDKFLELWADACTGELLMDEG
jgi:hypothetical protein